MDKLVANLLSLNKQTKRKKQPNISYLHIAESQKKQWKETGDNHFQILKITLTQRKPCSTAQESDSISPARYGSGL